MCAKWTVDPSRFCKIPIENIDKVRRLYAFEIFRRVVNRTPVDTGQARGAWLPSLNQPEDGVPGTKDKSGQETINKIKSVVESAKGEDTLFLVNSLDYIKSLEYGWYGKWDGGNFTPANTKKVRNGYSIQAGSGMVGVTMAQANQIFEQAVRIVKGGG
jgi:hypothetical protein